MTLKNIAVILKDEPGSLAGMGEVLGNAGISLEGGGVFVYNNIGIANFLVGEPEKAQQVLTENGFQVNGIHDVLILKLKQDQPGQLGKICRIMVKNQINIIVQYSDHANQLILVVDDHSNGERIVKNWK